MCSDSLPWLGVVVLGMVLAAWAIGAWQMRRTMRRRSGGDLYRWRQVGWCSKHAHWRRQDGGVGCPYCERAGTHAR